ncbi:MULTISPECIES: ABC transporter permease [unclassified Pseudomonas]|uniref:ABC transporter permease n=1 Tax=unclassified Pseudomonas TaxID=196821 RepID=UPI000BA44CA4|nr:MULTISPECIES: iron export ABC transporter permease subunit FetB [unclassified Pseudomonas]MCU1730133.1 iron export ABC transporter permease subunit FetB [Pseudomonas sp. 20P_3.2_Bac4]MCU1747568.1 iron export ABC transporter permease subunit FetB [Pseudomonas sp. 20P_3.2_Bac5]
MNYQTLSYTDLGIASALILINGLLSVLLKLQLERQLLLAAVRTVVQLLAIGYVLGWVFQSAHWYVVLPLMLAMTLIAGISAAGRGKQRHAGLLTDSVVAVGLSSWLVTALGLFVVLRVRPWYEPQYAIPILGMVLGNTLTAVSLGLDRMTRELSARRDVVEMVLALGGTRWEAAQAAAVQAVKAGMMPTLNQMTVVGIVSLPGMMTGQILAGQSPAEAVRYQIVIMFLIAAASALGTVCAVLMTFNRLFSPAHQFMSHRLTPRK